MYNSGVRDSIYKCLLDSVYLVFACPIAPLPWERAHRIVSTSAYSYIKKYMKDSVLFLTRNMNKLSQIIVRNLITDNNHRLSHTASAVIIS